MGSLRFYLALAVVIAHTGGLGPVHVMAGDAAVQIFFLISGFFMAMVLTERYNSTGALGAFYISRAVRIYSLYWVVLIAAFAFGLAAIFLRKHGPLAVWLDEASRIGPTGLSYLIFSNLFIVGQDLTLFLRTGVHGLAFTPDFSQSSPPVHQFLLVPQAWSISLELCFYLIAPFIMRLRTRYLVAACVLLTALRVFAASRWLVNDPWSYRFFPFELVHFFLGAICYRMYSTYVRPRFTQRAGLAASVVLAVALVAYGFCTSGAETTYFNPARLALLTTVFLTLPFVFEWSKATKFDRYIGDLSYPIYLSHLLVLWVVNAALHRPSGDPLLTLLVVAGTVCASAVLAIAVEKPADRFRHAVGAAIMRRTR